MTAFLTTCAHHHSQHLQVHCAQDADIALTYSQEAEAAEALNAGAVLVNQSHWGRLRVTGQDALKFLHGQSTNEFISLRPGQGRHTVRHLA